MTMTEDHPSGHPLGLSPSVQPSGSAREAVNQTQAAQHDRSPWLFDSHA